MKTTPYAELERQYAEILDLEHALEVLGWDQEVIMPAASGESRAQTLATLSTVIHKKITHPILVRLVQRLYRQRKDLTPQQRRAVHLVRNRVMKATRVPATLMREIALAESRGVGQWREAREKKDFSKFAPALSELVDLRKEVARLTARGGRLYDALLDNFEPGLTVSAIDPLFEDLINITVPLVTQVIESGVNVDLTPFVGDFDITSQRAFASEVATAMGIDLDRARMDLSTHPFCGGVAPDDVRMTSRYDTRDMASGLYGVIHEAGHGIYEQGLSKRRSRHPLGGAISMAIHESQSRLWENNVGRSHAFWTFWLPRMKKHHPQLKGVTVDATWKAANAMGPSPIRVEADELTYNLHIILRYQIERELIDGDLRVNDLPKRWNKGMKELLGIQPRNDAEGVLQDIHWAQGAFGYFPTYSMGNLYAAQFMEAARKSIRGLNQRITKGNFKILRSWLNHQIHQHDQVYTAEQMVRRVTGKPLSTKAFAHHVRKKVDAIYS